MPEETPEFGAAVPTGPREPNLMRGGRRQGRDGSHRLKKDMETHRKDNRQDGCSREPGNRGAGRGAGRSRGGRDRHNRNQRNRPQVASDVPGGAGQPPGGPLENRDSLSDLLTEDAKRTEASKNLISTAIEEPDGEICFICTSKAEHISIAPCNHRTCHICALRWRALYKTKACAHCRTESSFVIFTNNPVKRFEEFGEADIVRTDSNLGIKYEREEIFEDNIILLRYNCPDKECDVACLGWPDLHRHVRAKHGKVMCDLCTRNKKVFTHEHELFTLSQLRRHEKHGDDTPGAVDQSGFKGHPECEFCRRRFYGDDELYSHCREKHERCHICDRRSGSLQPQYFVDYDALEDHFQKDHFLCLDKECLEKKFVVFESQMDLKGHQLETHPEGLSKDARRDVRTVDMSTFDYRAPYRPGQRRDGRGTGRGRDPNADPLPTSSAQPLRRDELAYQRQMAIQSTQPMPARSFSGRLTPGSMQTLPIRLAGSTPVATPPTPLSSTTKYQSTSADSEPLTRQEQARRLRHAVVMERASNLLQNDPLKISEFRAKVSDYHNSIASAPDLIDSFFSLFDTASTELGKLIKELAEIYEDESKRNALLKAWNDWRAINEDYPDLPGSPNIVSNAGAGGKRVLRLKSSTTQSSRSAVGRSLSSGNPFPLLPSAHAASRTDGITTAWATASSLPPSRPVQTLAAPTPRSAAASLAIGGRGTNDTEAFPALPTAPKPNTMMAGLTRGAIRWDNRRDATPNAWGMPNIPSKGESTPVFSGIAYPDSEDTTENAIGKKGKGKKGKQTLFHFG